MWCVVCGPRRRIGRSPDALGTGFSAFDPPRTVGLPRFQSILYACLLSKLSYIHLETTIIESIVFRCFLDRRTYFEDRRYRLPTMSVPSDETPPALSLAVARIVALFGRRADTFTYPSLSSMPETSAQRLSRAAVDTDGNDPIDQSQSDTVLYLAYGSNMCAATFLGMRGIRPLSHRNVSVPTLRLTFDLPGMPYREPCFANVDWRKLPEKPKLPPTPKPPFEPSHPPHAESTWGGELMGVVYEVTQEDYRKIMATEGGGASYKTIVVPCVPIPPQFSVPEKPPIPELPKPFLAKTLFAPYFPDTDLPDDPRKDKWWYKYVMPPHRPKQHYAQASPRYLKLLTDGAREHDLPDDYQRYLRSLKPYKKTTWRQFVGSVLLVTMVAPIFLTLMLLGPLLADKRGIMPRWLAVSTTVMINASWQIYDTCFVPIFGDGERTEERKSGWSIWGWSQSYGCSSDEEKAGLLAKLDDKMGTRVEIE